MAAVLASMLALLYLSVHVAAAASPCVIVSDKLSGGRLPSAKETYACFRTIPYNRTRADAIVDTVAKTFALWPYLDIAVKSPTPELPSKVDIIAGLKKIKATKYESDYAFNRAVYELIARAHDGHAGYLPDCYSQITIMGFPVFLYNEKSKPIVRVSSLVGSLLSKVGNETLDATGIDRNLYSEAVVSAVDGVPIMDFLTNLAKSTGYYKELGASFNSLFSRPYKYSNTYFIGGFAYRYFDFQKPTISLTLTREGQTESETITVPFFTRFGSYSSPFSTGEEYFEQYCKADTLTLTKSKGNKAAFLPQMVEPIEATFSPISERRVAKLSGTPTQLVSDLIDTWLLPDNKTGVMIVPDFDVSPNIEWMAAARAGVDALKKLGIKRIIIDLQDCPGGDAVLNDQLVYLFFPFTRDNTYDAEFRASPLAQELVNVVDKKNLTTSFFHWSNFRSTKNKLFTSKSGFFFPVVTKTFSGRKGPYSSLVRYPNIKFPGTPSRTAPPPFKAKDILILTNGACYSACGDFTYRLEELAKVRTVALGGFAGRAMAYGGGVVGESSALSYFLAEDLPPRGGSAALRRLAPRPLPVRGDVYFTSLQAYTKSNTSVPAEFVFRPAKYRLQFTAATVLDKAAQWEAVTKLF